MRYFVFLLLLCSACAQGPSSENPEDRNPVSEQTGMISHLVFFNLHDSANPAAFMNELRSLAAIDAIEGMNFGAFKDLNDPRAMSQYELVMEIICKNEKAYQSYQAHDLHQALKSKVGQYLAAPPAVYDYTFATLKP